ncbi:MAG TPA: hypothetical protein VL974_00715 [Magnetospirillum sp.]|jgi:hypothetical protein|nr:hypothetical protein [Magnetospirillum sp.]
MRRLVGGMTACLLLAHVSAGAVEAERYVNVRYGFSICYPAWMEPQGEADNGDGQRFIAKDGGALAVWGQYDVLDGGLGEVFAITRDAVIGVKGQIAYERRTKDWFVISWTEGERVGYEKRTLDGHERIVGFRLSYPQTLKGKYEPIVSQLGKCLDTDLDQQPR